MPKAFQINTSLLFVEQNMLLSQPSETTTTRQMFLFAGTRTGQTLSHQGRSATPLNKALKNEIAVTCLTTEVWQTNANHTL